MSLPKQVQALADEAERLQNQVAGIAPETTEQPPTEEANAEPEGEQPVAEQALAPAMEPEAPKPEATTSDDETWERRYKTIQGKYNAEVPRLNADLRDLRNQLATALTEIERIKEQKARPTEPAQPLVTDKDVEAFGSDLIDVIDRKAREVAAQMVGTEMAELKAENQRLNDQLSGVTERQVSNDRRTYFAELARLVPDYEVLNVDEGFLGWLSEVDPLSGLARQDYLTNAWNSFDFQRTAALFNAYKQMTAPPPTPEPAPAVKQQLQRQVAPGTSKVSTTAPSNTTDLIWTTSEIDQFYKAVSRGDYRGNEAEQVRIEAEIDRAVAEGRIR